MRKPRGVVVERMDERDLRSAWTVLARLIALTPEAIDHRRAPERRAALDRLGLAEGLAVSRLASVRGRARAAVLTGQLAPRCWAG